jgi:hypothetical protein
MNSVRRFLSFFLGCFGPSWARQVGSTGAPLSSSVILSCHLHRDIGLTCPSRDPVRATISGFASRPMEK